MLKSCLCKRSKRSIKKKLFYCAYETSFSLSRRSLVLFGQKSNTQQVDTWVHVKINLLSWVTWQVFFPAIYCIYSDDIISSHQISSPSVWPPFSLPFFALSVVVSVWRQGQSFTKRNIPKKLPSIRCLVQIHLPIKAPLGPARSPSHFLELSHVNGLLEKPRSIALQERPFYLFISSFPPHSGACSAV